MENKEIILEKIFDAPIETVWKAITEREQLKQWYFDFSEDFKLELNQTFDWYAGDLEGKQWLHRGKMLEIIPNQKLVHSWEYVGYSGNSVVSWELISIDETKTKLMFSHRFIVPFDAKEEALRRENFVGGWNTIVNTLLPEYLAKK